MKLVFLAEIVGFGSPLAFRRGGPWHLGRHRLLYHIDNLICLSLSVRMQMQKNLKKLCLTNYINFVLS